MAVEEAVVAPLPLHDLVLAGVGAGQADGRLGGLGAGVGEAQLLDAGNGLDDLASYLVVELVRERVQHAALGDLGDDRVQDGLGAMAEDHGAVADAPVDVRVAVDVEEVGALAALHHDGTGADEACVAGLAAGDDLLALGEHLLGLLESTVVDEVVSHRADLLGERPGSARLARGCGAGSPEGRTSLPEGRAVVNVGRREDAAGGAPQAPAATTAGRLRRRRPAG